MRFGFGRREAPLPPRTFLISLPRPFSDQGRPFQAWAVPRRPAPPSRLVAGTSG